MRLFEWVRNAIKKMQLRDIATLKMAAILFGAILGAYFNAFVVANIWTFVVLVIVGTVYLLMRVFRK